MPTARIHLPLLLGGALLLTPGVLDRPARADEGCATAACHGGMMKKANAHPAADSCDSCHESTGGPHPQKGKKTFKLTKSPPDLCTDCHDSPATKKHVHPPVKDGDCTTCHDPHASDQASLLTAPVSELCTTCHGDKTEAPVLHGPVSAGDCTACHDPHQSDVDKLLKVEQPKVCFGCHSDLETTMAKKDVHPAIESGCTTCHDPHGSKNAKLLTEKGADLCFQCHGDIGDTVSHATVAHAPVASDKGCATCHSPHASDNDKLLLASEKDTCTGCHKDVITKQMTTLHGPIKEGHCTACHQPHGAENPHLLAKPFPATAYVGYTDQSYALCFGCHNPDLAKYPDTGFATNFRDGERNLHYVHVHDADKGRSCRMCHDVHGADNERLIAKSVKFGQWDLPIKYIKTENGGGCSPGCHKPYSYDRKNPGHFETPVKAPATTAGAASGSGKPH